MERQFTATVYILKEQQVLLIFHRKMNKWLPPGGHLDPNETPVEAARREAREETGLEINFIKEENIWIERWNARSFERPYLCLIEEIPAYKETPPHQHVDFIYLAHPIGGTEKENHQETQGMKWFTLEDIEQLVPDEEIFVETQQVIRKIFSSFTRDVSLTQNECHFA